MVSSSATPVVPYHLPFISESSFSGIRMHSTVINYYIKQKSGTERGQSQNSTPPCGIMEMGGVNSRLRDRGDDLGSLAFDPPHKLQLHPSLCLHLTNHLFCDKAL